MRRPRAEIEWRQRVPRRRRAAPLGLSRRRFLSKLPLPRESAMKNQPSGHTGRHFLQIPGPTNVPDRVLHAIAFPTIDHRGPEFGDLGKEVVAGMKRVFQTDGTVVVYPSSG